MLEQDEKKESGYWVTGTEKPMQRGKFCGHPCRINDPPPDRESRFFPRPLFLFWVVLGAKKFDGYGRKGYPQDQTDLLQCAVGCGSW